MDVSIVFFFFLFSLQRSHRFIHLYSQCPLLLHLTNFLSSATPSYIQSFVLIYEGLAAPYSSLYQNVHCPTSGYAQSTLVCPLWLYLQVVNTICTLLRRYGPHPSIHPDCSEWKKQLCIYLITYFFLIYCCIWSHVDIKRDKNRIALLQHFCEYVLLSLC